MHLTLSLSGVNPTVRERQKPLDKIHTHLDRLGFIGRSVGNHARAGQAQQRQAERRGTDGFGFCQSILLHRATAIDNGLAITPVCEDRPITIVNKRDRAGHQHQTAVSENPRESKIRLPRENRAFGDPGFRSRQDAAVIAAPSRLSSIIGARALDCPADLDVDEASPAVSIAEADLYSPPILDRMADDQWTPVE
ncbi:hypothetical protein [Burkholderia sp. Ac-20353]|uniref:hypothetical protein n=1 Tax=Burkholderia sp. Ac-20353 TaxID=2703894 RepID=UPI00197B0A20|nr:hypothetical protein [Burkholderia sp. Ac-20353]MBN3786121.1 hypothetical protein [Burkholderia sp. Ac-20353]